VNIIEPKKVEIEYEGNKVEIEMGLPNPLARNDALRKSTKSKLLDNRQVEREFDEVTFDEEMTKACIKKCPFQWIPENIKKLSLIDYDKISLAYKEVVQELEELKKKSE